MTTKFPRTLLILSTRIRYTKSFKRRVIDLVSVSTCLHVYSKQISGHGVQILGPFHDANYGNFRSTPI